MQNDSTLNTGLDFMKAALDAQNNRVIVFSAVKGDDSEIIDFVFALVSGGTLDFFDEDPTGKKISELATDADYQIQLLKQVYSTGKTNNWTQSYDYNETTEWYEATDSKSGDYVVRVWQNITKRRKNEQKINLLYAARAEEKYLSLFNAIEQGFCIIEVLFDESGKPYDYIFLQYNPAFEMQTGLKNALGKSIKELNPNHEQHWFDLYGEIATTGKPKYFEQEAVLINGWYEVSAFPVNTDVSNNVAVIFNDITLRKKAEQELRAFNSRLEKEVEERTASLNLANTLLEQKIAELDKTNKELESFNYIASHDLQEPLRKIQTFLTLIQQRSADHAAVDEYMKKIFTSTERMSSLISDLLTYSRLNAERHATRIDLNVVLTNVLLDYEVAISEKNAHIQSDVLPVIEAIPPQMHQLFSNLVSNALKYSSGTPTINIQAKTVNQNGKQMAEITFSDNGIGFDDKYADQIFKLFKRLHGRSEYGGTGIGLSICKKIVDQHGGSISAKSSYGNGAVFTILLPL